MGGSVKHNSQMDSTETLARKQMMPFRRHAGNYCRLVQGRATDDLSENTSGSTQSSDHLARGISRSQEKNAESNKNFRITDNLRQELALLQEEVRIKDARMAGIPPHRRPFYRPTERVAILELRVARGWSLQQTAVALLVTAATVASWMERLDDDGANALVQLRAPVNKLPEFVRSAVERLQPCQRPRE
jgi:hypothetical protein